MNTTAETANFEKLNHVAILSSLLCGVYFVVTNFLFS